MVGFDLEDTGRASFGGRAVGAARLTALTSFVTRSPVPESLLSLSGARTPKARLWAVYILGRLAGPLRFDGWRGGVCSVNREKANELRLQCEQIAEASGIEGLTFKRSPAPGHIESASGRLDILSAERSAGHASGFDDAIVDELGLLPEGARELVAGMRSSVSARGGRFMALSITGDAPFTARDT